MNIAVSFVRPPATLSPLPENRCSVVCNIWGGLRSWLLGYLGDILPGVSHLLSLQRQHRCGVNGGIYQCVLVPGVIQCCMIQISHPHSLGSRNFFFNLTQVFLFLDLKRASDAGSNPLFFLLCSWVFHVTSVTGILLLLE